MPRPDPTSLWHLTAAAGLPPDRFIADADGRLPLAELAAGSNLDAAAEIFSGRSVLISCDRQLPAALALMQLDGIARSIVLCPPDLAPMHLPAVIAEAEVDTIVCDGTGPAAHPPAGMPIIACSGTVHQVAGRQNKTRLNGETAWLLFTSGTTGRPKMVVHTLASLTGPLAEGPAVSNAAVWSTFYDIRRYGGLQILLRALLGGGSLVLSQASEPVGDFLTRAGQSGVTHMLGTPSHWRRALMSPAVGRISPSYVRLSGEVADQAILNHLAAAFPRAAITHAFASTEAGVGFEVRDGRAGFPADLIGRTGERVELRVEDGSLRIRSARTASRYLGGRGQLAGADGFVDTGDMVALRGDRYYFVGRREGIINVGGQKVHPEEVEAVINQHRAVQMARVRGRPSPITGAIVVADIVVRPSTEESFEVMTNAILAACRSALPAHKVPAMLRQVPSLDIAASGKLVRLPA